MHDLKLVVVLYISVLLITYFVLHTNYLLVRSTLYITINSDYKALHDFKLVV
jgi:hypothetical protein